MDRDGKAGKEYLYALLTSVLIGLLCGGVCVLFYACTQFCDQTRIAHEKLLYLLPAAGLLVVLLYDGLLKEQDLSMGALYRCVQEGSPVSLWIAPLIFLSTCLAYLTGGSVGRAGSALQIGGGLAVGRTRSENRNDMVGLEKPMAERNWRTAEQGAPMTETEGPDVRNTLRIVCGMSAGFTAILNTPLAGAFFGAEVLVLSRKSWHMLLPALISSYLTWGIAAVCGRYFGLSYTDFAVLSDHFEGLALVDYGKLAVLALAACLVARLYCFCRRITAWGMERLLRNPYLRVLAGTLLVILLTKLIGNMDCNGVGFSYVAQALGGSCAGSAFAWKLVLTVLTLGCGIRGGEIAPNIFIGATFGCAAAGLLGLDPCVGAAAGLVCVLGGVTNCSIAIFIYGCEAICLSPAAAAVFLLVSVIGHVFSGEIGLYREQPSDRIFGKLCYPSDRMAVEEVVARQWRES